MNRKQQTPITAAYSTDARWAMVGVSLMVFMATLDFSIVNIALPTLVHSLNTTFAAVQWIIISYTLSLTSLILTASRMGDMFGKKRVFFTGLIIFTFASLLCGLAPSVGWLIAFRGLQGVGAAMTQALGVAIIAESVPPSRRGHAIGIVGSTVSVGLAAGPSLGGLLLSVAGWRSIFFINIPVGIFAVFIIARYVKTAAAYGDGEKFDIIGAVLLFISLVCYSLGMTWGQLHGFEITFTRALIVSSFALFFVFLIVQYVKRSPMLDLKLFINPLFSLNLLMGLSVFIALAGNFILPFYLELVRGYSAGQTGMLMMAVPLTMGMVSPYAGTLADKFGSRWISLLGLLVVLIGSIAIGNIGVDAPWYEFVLRVLPFGLGMGLFQAPNNTAIISEAPKNRLGVASGLLNYSRVFGQTSGIPLAGTLFAGFVLSAAHLENRENLIKAPAEALVKGIQGTYLTLSGMVVLGIVLAVTAIIMEKKRKAAAR